MTLKFDLDKSFHPLRNEKETIYQLIADHRAELTKSFGCTFTFLEGHMFNMFNALSLKFEELAKVAEEATSRFQANFLVKSLRTIPDGIKNAVPGLNFSLIKDNPTTFEQLRSEEPVKEEKGMKPILS